MLLSIYRNRNCFPSIPFSTHLVRVDGRAVQAQQLLSTPLGVPRLGQPPELPQGNPPRADPWLAMSREGKVHCSL